MATMKQIAQIAGVSRGTVDRVLNNRGAVNPDTAKRVWEIARSLQYTPNRAALSLAARKRNISLTYVMFDPKSNVFFSQVEQGVRAKAAQLAENGVTVHIRYADDRNPITVVAQLEEAVAAGTAGIVVAGLNLPEIRDKLREITAAGIPVVVVNSEVPDCGQLVFLGHDSFLAGRTAAGIVRLIHRDSIRAGIILGSRNSTCHEERMAGFRSVLEENPALWSVTFTAVNGDDEFDSFSVVKEQLQAHPDTNTLFLATGSGVFGACRAVESLNLPQPPAIVCYDCPPSTRQMLEKGLISATICQQPERQGSEPLDILFNYIALDVQPEQEKVLTDIQILIRENL